MSDNAAPQQPRAPRDRSPAFPAISLKAAIDRLEKFEATFQRHPAPYEKAGIAWGIKEGSSQSNQILAALKYYGLLDYGGSGKNRQVSISDAGRTYLRAQQDHIKQQVIREAALKPKAFALFWPRWGAGRPIDAICLDQLVLEHGFNANSAPIFLRVYDETIAFAGLSDSDKTDEEAARDTTEDESEEDAEEEQISSPQPRKKRREVKPGMKEDVFTLKEGDVTLQWPEHLSQESYEDLEAWTKLILRKVQRHVVTERADDSE